MRGADRGHGSPRTSANISPTRCSGRRAAAQGQEPFVVFDRARPESYWEDFAIDLAVVLLPVLGLLLGAALFVGLGLAGRWQPLWLGVGLLLAGIGSLIKTRFAYRGRLFEHR